MTETTIFTTGGDRPATLTMREEQTPTGLEITLVASGFVELADRLREELADLERRIGASCPDARPPAAERQGGDSGGDRVP